MRSFSLSLAAALAAGLAAAHAEQPPANLPQLPAPALKPAQPALGAAVLPGPQCFVPYIPKAPDMLGPGMYAPNLNGLIYGPNYCVYPPFPPYQGVIPGPCPGMPLLPGMQPQVSFPTHPFARGPRDFYMFEARNEHY